MDNTINGETPRFEFGFYTFGNIVPDAVTGNRTSHHQRIQEIIELAKLAQEIRLHWRHLLLTRLKTKKL